MQIKAAIPCGGSQICRSAQSTPYSQTYRLYDTSGSISTLQQGTTQRHGSGKKDQELAEHPWHNQEVQVGDMWANLITHRLLHRPVMFLQV